MFTLTFEYIYIFTYVNVTCLFKYLYLYTYLTIFIYVNMLFSCAACVFPCMMIMGMCAVWGTHPWPSLTVKHFDRTTIGEI